jgi:hypothetical protein
MRLVGTIEKTDNYQLNLFEFWSDQIKAWIKTYGVVNIHTGVIESGIVQTLADAREIMVMLDADTYPPSAPKKEESKEPLLN